MTRRGARFGVFGHLATLRRYAQSLRRRDVDAEDLLHDALVCVYEKRATFHTGSDLKV
jgi:DNA-directed RNA polymerase specialized sigma24 family protein